MPLEDHGASGILDHRCVGYCCVSECVNSVYLVCACVCGLYSVSPRVCVAIAYSLWHGVHCGGRWIGHVGADGGCIGRKGVPLRCSIVDDGAIGFRSRWTGYALHVHDTNTTATRPRERGVGSLQRHVLQKRKRKADCRFSRSSAPSDAGALSTGLGIAQAAQD